MFAEDSVPTLDSDGGIEVWHETEHAVTCFRVSAHPQTGVIVHNLEQGRDHTWEEIWPYPGDVIVYGDSATHTDSRSRTTTLVVEAVLDLFGVQYG